VIPVKHTPYPGSKDGQMAGGDTVAIPDPLIPLAYVAAITKTIKLATGILILPQRHPIYTAKEVATLDVLYARSLRRAAHCSFPLRFQGPHVIRRPNSVRENGRGATREWGRSRLRWSERDRRIFARTDA